jgi:hypothetical protein
VVQEGCRKNAGHQLQGTAVQDAAVQLGYSAHSENGSGTPSGIHSRGTGFLSWNQARLGLRAARETHSEYSNRTRAKGIKTRRIKLTHLLQENNSAIW